MKSSKLIAVVAGTRPEAIKMAPVYFALKESAKFETVFLATAQHREMLDRTLETFGIQPEFDLNLMQPGQSLAALTGRVIDSVSHWCQKYRPAALLVQGDTTTVLAASIAGFYNHVPLGHVEAGLRTGDIQSPFPEEMNRRLTSPLVRWHFCPTELSRRNLLQENIRENVHVTGNSVIDALLWVRNKLKETNRSLAEVEARVRIPETFARSYMAENRPWLLVTGHRRESFGDGFERICLAIRKVVDKFPNLGVLYPVHLNPQVREPVHRILGGNDRIALVEPAGYEDFVWLMDRAHFILSDSGGVQEEAPSLGKPVLVMRETTERPEGIEAGTCRLVGTCSDTIVREVSLLLESPEEYRRRTQLANPYGDGTTSLKIRSILESDLG